MHDEIDYGDDADATDDARVLIEAMYAARLSHLFRTMVSRLCTRNDPDSLLPQNSKKALI